MSNDVSNRQSIEQQHCCCFDARLRFLQDRDLNSFDFPPYIKKIDFSSLFSLLSYGRECPCKKMLFSLSVKHVGGNCWSVQVVMVLTVAGMTTGDTSIDLAESVSYPRFFSEYGA